MERREQRRTNSPEAGKLVHASDCERGLGSWRQRASGKGTKGAVHRVTRRPVMESGLCVCVRVSAHAHAYACQQGTWKSEFIRVVFGTKRHDHSM